MAFSDFKFVRTQIDDALSAVLLSEVPEPPTWDEFVEDLIEHHYKVSITFSTSSQSYIFTASTTKDHKHPFIGISCHGGDAGKAARKVFALMSLMPSYDESPLHIEKEIDKARRWMLELVQDRLTDLKVNNPKN